jgi:hypothetical protein
MQKLQEDIKPSQLEVEIKAILQNRELDDEEKILAILELDEPSIDEALAEKIVKGYVRSYRVA